MFIETVEAPEEKIEAAETTEITETADTAQAAATETAASENDTPAEEGTRKPYRQGNNMNRRKKKVCIFCADKTATIDYKEAGKQLKKFTSERGKILPRRVTGTCAYHQREITRAIKLARVIALLPYTTD